MTYEEAGRRIQIQVSLLDQLQDALFMVPSQRLVIVCRKLDDDKLNGKFSIYKEDTNSVPVYKGDFRQCEAYIFGVINTVGFVC